MNMYIDSPLKWLSIGQAVKHFINTGTRHSSIRPSYQVLKDLCLGSGKLKWFATYLRALAIGENLQFAEGYGAFGASKAATLDRLNARAKLDRLKRCDHYVIRARAQHHRGKAWISDILNDNDGIVGTRSTHALDTPSKTALAAKQYRPLGGAVLPQLIEICFKYLWWQEHRDKFRVCGISHQLPCASVSPPNNVNFHVNFDLLSSD